MLHLLNKSINVQFLFLFLLTGWTVWTIFAHTTPMPPEGTPVLYQLAARIWTWSPVVMRIITLLIVVTMTIGVIHDFHQNHFSDNRTYIPGIFLLLVLNCGKFLYTFSPALLTSFFIALIMIIYKPSESATKLKDRIFTFGLIIAVASMMDICAFGLVLFLLMTISFNNVTPFKDSLILLIGLLFIYLYAFSAAFIFDVMPDFLQSWRNLSFFIPAKQITRLSVIEYVTLAYFIVLIVYLFIRDKRLLDNKLIVIRQAFANNNLLFISMLIFLWLGVIPLPNALIYLLLPLSVLISVAVIPKRRRFVLDIMVAAFCVLLCL